MYTAPTFRWFIIDVECIPNMCDHTDVFALCQSHMAFHNAWTMPVWWYQCGDIQTHQAMNLYALNLSSHVGTHSKPIQLWCHHTNKWTKILKEITKSLNGCHLSHLKKDLCKCVQSLFQFAQILYYINWNRFHTYRGIILVQLQMYYQAI